ncbi:NAD-dependent epimerase/dehydratase family protein [Thiovibrio frasassiensis]|uniref:NAD-dependent epimerase/dehydratase family protein n=1 Tax=Thiovibrio frasassiensis TaxID=2984131 RepID=A0A9X4MI98_9BACT|nr:NAD-dependent epimerase/dehydratase family protein [Thiovibrio frasassiensis]MDG4476038.1 NAD-dependent epimerase/dehydratase family protein [Thiovibrio frasassiensis]
MNINTTLVIGGAGYIGAHLVPQLLATGRQVTVLGRRTHPLHELPPDTVYVAGDFSQRDLIGRLLDTHEEVIHLAYATVPNTSFENPLADLLQNLPPTEELFSEVAVRGRKLLLVSSGGTVYGEANNLPIREDHPTKPISPYGVTKLTLENYAYLYAVTHGLKYICVRPGNAYGMGQQPFVGQGFVSTAIASVLRRQPIKIFGQTGTVRDYIYVSDLASGIVSALDRGRLSETYNIGSGIGRSNTDIIQALIPLMQEIGVNVQMEHLPERAFDVKSNILDSTKLFEHTGWRPVHEFDEGLRCTLEWLRQLLNE